MWCALKAVVFMGFVHQSTHCFHVSLVATCGTPFTQATGQAVTSQDVRSLPDFVGMRPTDIARRVGLVGMAQLLVRGDVLHTKMKEFRHL